MPTSAFEYFLQRKNARVVQLLNENETIAGAMQGLLEHLVDFAADKGVPFRQLDLGDIHVTRDHYVVGQIRVRG